MRIKPLMILLLLTLLIILVLPVNLTTARETPEVHPAREATLAVLTAFHLYSSFLGETHLNNGKAIPIHGPTPAQAIYYLLPGFSPELALAIVEETTRWDEDKGTLVVVPRGGIPVLTEADVPHLVPVVCSETRVLFERRYQDCFFPGDSYLYTIEVIKTDGVWKVKSLGLQEENLQEKAPWPTDAPPP